MRLAAVGLAVVALIGCGGGDAPTGAATAAAGSAKIVGKVKLAGAASSAGIVVSAIGPSPSAALTVDDGTYTLESLAPGSYAITAAAANTVEGEARTLVTVKDKETGTAPELALTPTGEITGKAVLTPDVGSNAGIQIAADGATSIAVTAADGSFRLTGVPAGEHTVVATRTGYATATAKVTVEYGKASTATGLSLVAGQAGTGLVVGVARFFNKADATGIKVEVEGTTVSAVTDADGNYTLKGVPSGYLTLVASATGYQPSRLENLLSLGGGTFRAPEMKLYLGQMKFSGTVTTSSVKASPDGKTVVFYGTPAGSSAGAGLFLLASDKPAARLLDARGTSSSFTVFSPDGKYIAYVAGGALYLAPVEGGSPFKLVDSFTTSDPVAFAPDSSAFAYIGPPEPPNNNRTLMSLTLPGLQLQRIDEIRTSLRTDVYCRQTGDGWAPTSSHPVFRFSPDGKALAYVALLPASAVGEMRMFKDGAPINLTSAGDPGCFTFSGDSNTLIWATRTGSNYEAYTAPTNSSAQPLKLASSTSTVFLSPDQKWVVAATPNATYSYYYDYAAWPVVGGSSVPFQTRSTIRLLAPGGSAIFFNDYSSTTAYVISDPLGAKQTLTGWSSSYVSQFSPQGTHFLYVTYKSPAYVLNSVDLSPGGASVQLSNVYSYYSSSLGLVLAPDDSLAVFKNDKGELAVSDLSGAKPAAKVGPSGSTLLSFAGTHVLWKASDYSMHAFDTVAGVDHALGVKMGYYTTVYVVSSDKTRVYALDQNRDLFAAKLDGSDPLVIDNSVDQVVEGDPAKHSLWYVVSGARPGVYLANSP